MAEYNAHNHANTWAFPKVATANWPDMQLFTTLASAAERRMGDHFVETHQDSMGRLQLQANRLHPYLQHWQKLLSGAWVASNCRGSPTQHGRLQWQTKLMHRCLQQ